MSLEIYTWHMMISHFCTLFSKHSISDIVECEYKVSSASLGLIISYRLRVKTSSMFCVQQNGVCLQHFTELVWLKMLARSGWFQQSSKPEYQGCQICGFQVNLTRLKTVSQKAKDNGLLLFVFYLMSHCVGVSTSFTLDDKKFGFVQSVPFHIWQPHEFITTFQNISVVWTEQQMNRDTMSHRLCAAQQVYKVFANA